MEEEEFGVGTGDEAGDIVLEELVYAFEVPRNGGSLSVQPRAAAMHLLQFFFFVSMRRREAEQLTYAHSPIGLPRRHRGYCAR